MKVKLYICNADKERVDKSSYLEEVGEYDGFLRAPSSVERPLINLELGQIVASSLIDGDDEIVIDEDDSEVMGEDARITQANYMYIPEFGRYYFIDDIVVAITKLYQITASVDPLMSFKREILGLTCYIERNEYDFSFSEQDDLLPMSFVKEIEEYKPDDGGFVNVSFSGYNVANTEHIALSVVSDAYESLGQTIVPPVTHGLTDGRLLPFYADEFVNYGGNDVFSVERGVLKHISKAVVEDDTLLSFIKSAVAFPFEIPHSPGMDDQYIYFGLKSQNRRVPVMYDEDDVAVEWAMGSLINYMSHYLVLADFRLPAIDSYLGLEPFSRYEIFIPFYGYYELNRQLIGTDRLILYYCTNYADGSATAFLYDYTKKVLLFSTPCQLGVKLSFDSTNLKEITARRDATNTNLAIGLISSALSVGAGIATFNPLMAVGGGLGMVKSITAYNNANAMLFDTAKASFDDSSSCLYAPLDVRIRITKMKSVLTDGEMEGYAHAVGRPLRQLRRLSTLRGFTIAKSVHLDDIPCLSGEADQIKRSLAQGVIL